ncbi:transcription-silencing protein Clr2-domain-containing protein [Amylocarpus encephaloides]|uniref:Transcription-silencing protein Clr2-domain-containing protein n=1 Tax=Amylocarpus encephaloides TaxID=45428 RepID=A0A9P7Y903_9HELO|nr:transcription-silencing protein Clr2-domain-containing protein [Amylocarpus encephaloides]
MAPYYPITICRSDGQLSTVTKSGIVEPNEPTAVQRDATPDNKGNVDVYKRLDADESKAVDWRRKLAGMFMHEYGKKEHANKKFILSELPEGYVLWEHLKYNVDKINGDKKEKGKHAGGVYERQDAYLYGHPQGRKKRFRSPADFFHHMIWLSWDQEGDNRNCSCKFCSPDGSDDEVVEDAPKIESPMKKETKPVVNLTTPTRPPQPAYTVSQSSVKPPPAVAPQSNQPKQAKSTFQPALNNAPKFSAEQRVDGEANGKYLFRTGELVWFFNNGLNWRLGVISKRQILNGKPRYLIQPLSNPFQHQPYQIKDDEESIRPWLAWSVPNTTVPTIQNLTYEQVPWEQVVRGAFDEGQAGRDYIVDGSILAAKVIDSSYSLYDRIEGALVGPGEVHYRGMFLGAEKVWVGEPVRLRVSGNDIVVLIIQKLIERTTPPSTSNVTFIGDVYKFVDMPSPYTSRAQWPTNSDLPPRMISDLRYRNEVADNAKTGQWYEWRLLEPAARKSLSDIKGRWYETRTLLPILRTAQVFQQEVAKGLTSDAGSWMNGRRDKNNNPETRKKNRRDTLGRSVPQDFKVSRGLDGTPADNAFPDAGDNAQAVPENSGYVESDIDQFMDLGDGDYYPENLH